MSPWPRSKSAPFWSSTMRLSMRLLTRNATRVGMLDLTTGEPTPRGSLEIRKEEAEAAREHHADVAWVRTLDETIDQGWWGPVVTDAARSRLGDVALVAREPVSFHDDADTGPYQLVGRHGSLTAAEMYVPLLVGGA